MARSDRNPATGHIPDLLELVRRTGNRIERAAPPFDVKAGEERLRLTARSRGLLRDEAAPEDQLAVSGDQMEEDAPPFDADAGAARLAATAHALGLLRVSGRADDTEPRTIPDPDFATSFSEHVAPGGRVLGDRYRLLSAIGAGGMGSVWAAFDLATSKTVVLKEMLAAPAELGKAEDRALREARAQSQIQHPAVIPVHDVFLADGHPWIVMDHIKGRSLDSLIRDAPLPESEVAALGSEIADALIAIHAAGIVHRDLKPANILISDERAVYIVDFGVSLFLDEATPEDPVRMVGTLEFMAPERLAHSGEPASPASDLWSLGVTLFIAMEGYSPFRRNGPEATVQAILQDMPPRPSAPGVVSDVVQTLLLKDPRARPTATEVARALTPALTAGPGSGRTVKRSASQSLGAHDDTVEAASHLMAIPTEEAAQVFQQSRVRPSGKALQAIAAQDLPTAIAIFRALKPDTAGRLLGYLAPDTAAAILADLPPALAGRILAYAGRAGTIVTRFSSPVAAELIEAMPVEQAVTLLAFIEPDAAARILASIASDFRSGLLASVDPDLRAKISDFHSSHREPPDSIGQEPLYQPADYLGQHGAKKKSGLAPSAGIRDATDRYGTGTSMYCIKCRAKHFVPSPEKVIKNGKPALKARCPACGTGMYKIRSK